MNKKINFPLVITLIVLCGVLLIIIVLQYSFIPGIKIPLFNSLDKESEDEIADWKTYYDEKCHFRIKYPADWYIKESYVCHFLVENMKEKVMIAGEKGTSNGSYFMVSISKHIGGFSSIEEAIRSYDLPDHEKQRRLDKITTMSLGDIELVVWDMESGIEFIKDGISGSIHGSSGSAEQREKDMEIFKKILSSFRFTEGEASFGLIIEEIEKYYEEVYSGYKKIDEEISFSGWDSYIENGYELKYPKDIYSFYDLKELKIEIYECNYDNFPEECPNKLDSYSVNKTRIELALAFGQDMIVVDSVDYCFLDSDSSTKFYITVKNNKCTEVYIVSSCIAYENYEKYKECMEYVEKVDRKIISTLKAIK